MTSEKLTRAVRIDRWVVIIIPILITVGLYFGAQKIVGTCSYDVSAIDGAENLKIMVNIWSALLGFLITAVSILLTLGDDKFVNVLRSTDHYKTILLSYIMTSVHLLIAIVIAVTWIFVKWWSMKIFCILVAISLDTMLMVLICLFFLFAIVLKVRKQY